MKKFLERSWQEYERKTKTGQLDKQNRRLSKIEEFDYEPSVYISPPLFD